VFIFFFPLPRPKLPRDFILLLLQIFILVGIDGLHSGKWLSGNGSVLSINRITGEGYAHGEGATQDVEISWNDKDLLSVNPLNIVSFGMVGISEYEVGDVAADIYITKWKTYEICIKDYSWIIHCRSKSSEAKNLKIRFQLFFLPLVCHPFILTKLQYSQRTEIDVTYEPEEATPASGVRNITWTAVLICAAVLIVTVVVFMRLLERPDRSLLSRQAGPTSSAVAGAATTDSISTGNFQSSPRTPQPFMEYVRRTIDETPYYNREGRRRFDPRYTY
ncbi:hypothetical protein BHM03_00011513, partial [Ensete ventricosum]